MDYVTQSRLNYSKNSRNGSYYYCYSNNNIINGNIILLFFLTEVMLVGWRSPASRQWNSGSSTLKSNIIADQMLGQLQLTGYI